MSLISISKLGILSGLLTLVFSFTKAHADPEWSLSVDVIEWYASEEIASIWADVITVGDNSSAWNAVGFDLNWSPGLRLGLSRSFECETWDTAIYWTWYEVGERQKIPFELRICPKIS